MLRGRGIRLRAGWGPLAVERGRSLRRLLERHRISHDRVLDLGCGEGGVLVGLDPNDLGVGLEIDAALAHQAARRLRGRAGRAFVTLGDGSMLPFKAAEFDLVVLFDVLEHARRWREILSETARVLRPGGSAYITAANIRSPITVLDDPHWHLPLVAVLPSSLGEHFVRALDPDGLQMGGDFPSFPSWNDLHAAVEAAGMHLELLSVKEKLIDPQAILDPTRRQLAHTRLVALSKRTPSGLLTRMLALWDRYVARGWAFIARKMQA